jgi:chromosome segregation ATPase
MLTWLKENWVKVLIGILIAFFCYSLVDLLISNREYKKRIKERDESIAQLRRDIDESEKRIDFYVEDARKWYLAATEKEERIKEKEDEIRKIAEERKELQEKIKQMPASTIVVRTSEILDCKEILEQQQGVLFSLSCARKNLSYLEDFSLVKKEKAELEDSYGLAKGEISDLKNALLSKDGIIQEKDTQLVDEGKIIEDWKAKFDLSEKRNKKSWMKGLKTGGIIGGILGLLTGLLLGR